MTPRMTWVHGSDTWYCTVRENRNSWVADQPERHAKLIRGICVTKLISKVIRRGPLAASLRSSVRIRTTSKTKSKPVARFASPMPPPLEPPKNGHLEGSADSRLLYSTGLMAARAGDFEHIVHPCLLRGKLFMRMLLRASSLATRGGLGVPFVGDWCSFM